MDYMGSHDLFDHLLTPSKKNEQTTSGSFVRRLFSSRKPSQAHNRRKTDPQFSRETAQGI